MEVILTEDVPNVGEMGELVSVSNGYGRNYLIPQKLAIPATKGNKKQLDHQLRLIDQRKEQEREEALKIRGTIDGVSVTIPKRVGEHDKLYGSVTSREIAEALSQHGLDVERKQVMLDDNLSDLGIYKIQVKLASGVFAEVRVWVVAM